MQYYVYILETVKNTLYCGITPDLFARFEAHKKGRGAKFTHAFKPLKIVYAKILPDKSAALKEEYRIKKTLTRAQKLELINENLKETEKLLKEALS